MDQAQVHIQECEPGPSCSKPLHVKRVEKALYLNTFLNEFKNEKSDSSSDDDDTSEKGAVNNNFAVKHDDGINDSEQQNNNEYFNFTSAGNSRSWLIDILQEESDSSNDSVDQYENLKMLLKIQSFKRTHKLPYEELKKDMYYGSGLLSNHDKYIENKRITPVKLFKKKVVKNEVKSSLYSSDILEDPTNDPCLNFNVENGMQLQNDTNVNLGYNHRVVHTMVHSSSNSLKRKTKKFKDEESKKKWEDMMTIKRRKIFTSIVKKEINKQHRVKMNKHKELLIQCKRVALQCQKAGRQKALQSSRIVKEQPWRMKRLARENLAYWKRSKRVDREIRRKLEKEAEEQRKMDFELIEAKRQQRKLNFLITQTELYAHFMSKKLGKATAEEQLRILSQLDEEKNPRLSSIDDYDCEIMKAKAKKNAHDAFQNEKARTKHFDMEANSKMADNNYNISPDGEHPQPLIFRGNLKGYQLRGMNWLANLYDQGISGILADEMGLGKTVQSIAFLCHIAERYSVWGPFLIISPASTLHNWQQEIAKFVPVFKVVPYWGNPNERKILRQFWDQKDMHTKDASFHIVITSYQIVITDIKYFNRIKWQYMILDEAQAIKSTSSMRWKTLLGFSCRNRLLLSGTPIQNSMAELWALLHFIMPTLFDSHEEFNEWFSKDIESHAENKTGIDEKHLSRLHMILKPFMLRRIKKDVENELSDKIEIMVYCPLTTRQKLLYMALKQKIRIEDLLHYTVGGSDSHVVDKNFTSNLMNLVMQFRKVCNHPELFERRDAKSPFHWHQLNYEVPALVYNDAKLELFLRKQRFFLFYTDYIAHSIRDDFNNSIFNFCVSLKMSPGDLFKIFAGDVLHRWKNYYDCKKLEEKNFFRSFWWDDFDSLLYFRSEMKLSDFNVNGVLKDLCFTWNNTARRVVYCHMNHYYHSMPETVEHRNIRYKKIDAASVNEISYEERPTRLFECEKTELPSFLFCSLTKVETQLPTIYCYSRSAVWDLKRHIDDYSWNSLNYYWSESTSNLFVDNPACHLYPVNPANPVDVIRPMNGWSHITIPDKETLVTDSGKLSVLDGLLKKLKEEGHRVLIYSQMTKMIDLLEEYMWHRHHKYMRLDGSSKISERRDMVADFQARTDIFVFLLSTRAGGLGINLTAADTVIFYDSDWNPTVDQQAMDRAHRLGQTKQVTVYRLICKGSIEERILQRAREKSEIQKLVISGGNFKPDTLKPKEVVSLLLDDEELEQKYRQRTEERKHLEDMRELDRKRKHMVTFKAVPQAIEVKKPKADNLSQESGFDEPLNIESVPNSPKSADNNNSPDVANDDGANNDSNFLDVEGDSSLNNKYTVYNLYGTTVKPRITGRGTSKRGRPRGSRRMSALGRFNSNTSNQSNYSSSSSIGTIESSPIENNTNASTQNPSTTFLDISMPSTSGGSSALQTSTVRRGPGRPRLKPGPPNRGSHRPRKPARPLPVPLPSDSANTNNTSANVSNYSSYLYDFPEHSDT